MCGVGNAFLCDCRVICWSFLLDFCFCPTFFHLCRKKTPHLRITFYCAASNEKKILWSFCAWQLQFIRILSFVSFTLCSLCHFITSFLQPAKYKFSVFASVLWGPLRRILCPLKYTAIDGLMRWLWRRLAEIGCRVPHKQRMAHIAHPGWLVGASSDHRLRQTLFAVDRSAVATVVLRRNKCKTDTWHFCGWTFWIAIIDPKLGSLPTIPTKNPFHLSSGDGEHLLAARTVVDILVV